MQPQQQKRSFIRRHFYRTFLATTLLASSQLLYGISAIAAPAPAGQIIQNKATGSFVDTDNSEKAIESNIVQVTVAEIAGITVTSSGVQGSPALGNTVYFDFTISNDGNDPTQFFIPGVPSAYSGGNPGTLQVIAYDPDGPGPLGSNGLTGVAVPNTGAVTATLPNANTFNNGSIPAGGTITVRVPITVTVSGGQPISVTLGDTPAAPNNNNQDYSTTTGGLKDLYTEDNSGTNGGDLVSGLPFNGDSTLHRKEGSATQSINAVPNIRGVVFEDVNYGGGAGRAVNTPGTAPRSNATVELYKSDGTFFATTTTNGSGAYTFTNTPAGDYIVRVVNSTVTSSRGTGAGLFPVQTFRTDGGTTAGVVTPVTDRVGGENPSEEDAPANNGSQTLANLNALTGKEVQSLTTVKVDTTDVSNIDFGYNFDTIVNTNNAGQGSLRQFVINSNVLPNTGLDQDANLSPAPGTTAINPSAGEETSIFMIPTSQLTSGVAVISQTTALPAFTDPFTTLDGRTQTANIGDSNSGLLGVGGTVGTGADGRAGTGDEATLSKVPAPEIEIRDGATLPTGLQLQANNITIKGIAIHGFGATQAAGQGDIYVVGVNNISIAQNVIGAQAISFTNPTAAERTGGSGVWVTNGAQVTIDNNLIGYTGYNGIACINQSLTSSAVVNITNNEFRGNAAVNNTSNAIELFWNGTNPTIKIQGNLLADTVNQGAIHFQNNAGGTGATLNIDNNTITNTNSTLAYTQAIILNLIQDAVVSHNIIENTNNTTLGVAIGIQSFANVPARRNRVTQNSIYGTLNGPGIDLWTQGQSTTAPRITANDGLKDITKANSGMDYPVISSSVLSGGMLTVKGFVGNDSAGSPTFGNATLEFFIADNTPADQNGEVIAGDGKSLPHGEGRTYIGTCFTDSNSKFDCSFANAGSLGLLDAKNITATATDPEGNTSEFSAAAVNNPNVVLVKRITRINGSTTSYLGDNLAAYKEELSNLFDDNEIERPIGNPPLTYPDTDKWPGTTGKTSSTFLLGGIDGGFAKPGDEVEYTIYFLSTGDQPARDIQFCDRIPDHQTFIPNSFSTGLPAAPGGLSGPRGISVQQNGTERAYTNIGGDDTARFYDPNGTFPAICNGSIVQTENNGAIFVDLGDVPNAIAPGTPGSYGFVRFRTKVK